MSYFWMSFVDPKKRPGERFAGACIVHGGDTGDDRMDGRVAINTSWEKGCNPGGEVMMARMRPHSPAAEACLGRWTNRLLSREECERFEEDMRRTASGKLS